MSVYNMKWCVKRYLGNREYPQDSRGPASPYTEGATPIVPSLSVRGAPWDHVFGSSQSLY